MPNAVSKVLKYKKKEVKKKSGIMRKAIGRTKLGQSWSPMTALADDDKSSDDGSSDDAGLNHDVSGTR